ncbi:hypothetical protein BMF94_1707 [Rhodotorula taiwanensis]|uniref:Mid2 domain-containing protein n=1 Tax=Rhodotorula taiwanensis TaxID=741276 RepID=A0A2S5BE84_9BASI|nr:hypothetical protein BMF94_1707 [Rhodotorula taiwanensis]
MLLALPSLLFLGALSSVPAQTTAPFASSTDTVLTTSLSATTTLTRTVMSASSASGNATLTKTSSTIAPAAPTANTTSTTEQSVRLWPPRGGLVVCERVEFAFTGPAVPKTCGVYVTNASTYLQQIALGGEFSSMTGGTFSWLVDLPAGLSVEIQLWVSLNNQVQQFTLHELVVQPSDDTSCIATGAGQNTQSIVSYASSLNSSWIYQAPATTDSSDRQSGSKIGPIVGGVVGSLGGFALVLLAIYLVCRRRARAIQPPPQIGFDSAYGDKSTYGDPASMTHAQMVALSYQGQQAGGSPLECGRQTPLVPYFSPQGEAASSFDSPVRAGTAPELMDVASHHGGTAPAPTPDVVPYSPRVGTQGLDDPATFSARRRE